MPRITDTHPVLDGRGTLYRHEGEERWRYREYDQLRRRYRTGLLTDANSLEDAKQQVIELVLKWTNTKQQLKPRTTAKSTNLTIADEVEVYMKKEREKERRHDRIERSLVLMLKYLSLKKISYAKQLKTDTFDDYIDFRKGIRKLTVRTELQGIRVFLVHHLRRKGLITNELANEPTLLPKIKITDDDLDANPSISKRDYEVINRYIRGLTGANKSQQYFRNYFSCLIHMLWSSGCRPGELLKVRIKDITIVFYPYL